MSCLYKKNVYNTKTTETGKKKPMLVVHLVKADLIQSPQILKNINIAGLVTTTALNTKAAKVER